MKLENPEYLLWRRERIIEALRGVPQERLRERNRRVSLANLGRKPVNTGVRTGTYIGCLNCNREFYRTPAGYRDKFCSRECWRVYQKTHWHELHPGIRRFDREDLIVEIGKCEVCGLPDTRVLVAHHVDFNGRNNSRENLILLCPTCHTKEHLSKEGKINFRRLRT